MSHPPRAKSRAALPIKGRWESVAALRPACGLLAATRSASGVRGGWLAEKRKILMARALRHAGGFRRANHGGCGTGPQAPLLIPPHDAS